MRPVKAEFEDTKLFMLQSAESQHCGGAQLPL